ncbi:MAG: hypothetical protein IJK26_09760 [Clostridia bacterium]|nr:hypothetical protein [Clostridia bacterium]
MRGVNEKLKEIGFPFNLLSEVYGKELDIEAYEYCFSYNGDIRGTFYYYLSKICTGNKMDIILLRYKEAKTLDEIAAIYGKSKEGINKIIAKVKSTMEKDVPIEDLKKGLDKKLNGINEKFRDEIWEAMERQDINSKSLTLYKVLNILQKDGTDLETAIWEIKRLKKNEVGDSVLDYSLDEFADKYHLSIRTFNCLYRFFGKSGKSVCVGISDILNYDEKYFLRIRNFGAGCLNELNEALVRAGLPRIPKEKEKVI